MAVENYLEVVWTCYGYGKVSSGYNLLNAPTLVIIQQKQTELRGLVQPLAFDIQKRGPLMESNNYNEFPTETIQRFKSKYAW